MVHNDWTITEPQISIFEEVFEIENNYIRCTIQFDEEVLDKLKTENVGLNKTEKKVVSLLIEDSDYTSEELVQSVMGMEQMSRWRYL